MLLTGLEEVLGGAEGDDGGRCYVLWGGVGCAGKGSWGMRWWWGVVLHSLEINEQVLLCCEEITNGVAYRLACVAFWSVFRVQGHKLLML